MEYVKPKNYSGFPFNTALKVFLEKLFYGSWDQIALVASTNQGKISELTVYDGDQKISLDDQQERLKSNYK